MSADIFANLGVLTGLQAREVIGSADRADLDLLIAELVHYFPDHAHVAGELEQAWAGEWPDDQVLVHGWLLDVDGRTAGFCIVHTNLRRGILVQHFIGMDPEVGRTLPLRWVGYLMDALRDTAIEDGDKAGVTILGQMGEHYPEHLRAWSRFGYVALDIDYQEPMHGRHWADHSTSPTFFPMIAMLRTTRAVDDLPLCDVAVRGVEAFLLDHYLLPPDDPTVERILAAAAHLPAEQPTAG